MRVDSCSKQYEPAGILSCHRFYKCIKGVPHSCQSPKPLSFKCDAKYYFDSQYKYKCKPGTTGGQDPCT